MFASPLRSKARLFFFIFLVGVVGLLVLHGLFSSSSTHGTSNTRVAQKVEAIDIENISLPGNTSEIETGPNADISKEIRKNESDAKVILFYTKWVKDDAPASDNICPEMKNRCILHSNRSLLRDADAVVFHAPNIPSEITKSYFDITDRTPRQRFVFFTLETPPNQWGLKQDMLPDNFFNWTMTYHSGSTAQYPYGGEWISQEQADEMDVKLPTYPIPENEIKKNRTHAIFAAISNCETPSKRHEFVKKLDKEIPVLMTGKCALRAEDADLCPAANSTNRFRNYTQQCLIDYFEDSYFFLALENSICDGYITEKYWERVWLNSVPILWTRKTLEDMDIPPKSAIFVDDFKSFKAFTGHLKMLMSNQTAYAEYHAWRNQGWRILNYRPNFCNLCARLWTDTGEHSVYQNALKWFTGTSKCHSSALLKRFSF